MKPGTREPNNETDQDPSLDSNGFDPIQKAWDSFARLVSRSSYIVVFVWLFAAFVAFEGYSKQKALWNDEILVKWVDTLPRVRDIWPQLKFGVSADPPLFHLITHGLISLFGSGAAVLRFPSMVGVCVMLLSLFLVLRRYIGPLYALLGMALPFCTILPQYAYEARPYGLMYGCLGIAIFCWAKLGEEDVNRRNWNVALCIALTASLACHFYSVFVLPAFYLGETVRTARRHRISWPTVVAMTIATVSEGLYLPIIIGIRKFSNNYFEKPTPSALLGMLHNSMLGLAIPLFSFLILVAIFVVLNFNILPPSGHNREEKQFQELAALALGFLLLPFLAWAAGVVFLHAFTTRYVLHGLFGVFIIFPLFVASAIRRDRTLGLALLLACALPALSFTVQGAVNNFRTPHYNDDFALLEKALPKLNGDLVISDPFVFTQLVNYSPDLKARCILLWNRDLELKYTGQDEASQGAEHGVQMGTFRAQAWADYQRRDTGFLFVTVPDSEPDNGWLRNYLIQADRYGDVVMKVGRFLVVEAKPSSAEPATPSPELEKPRATQ